MSAEEKRINQRVIFQEPVAFQGKELGHFGGSLARDLSEGGIRLTVNEFIPLHTELILKVPVDREKIADRVGRVVWIQKLPFMDRYHAGIQFERVDSPEYVF